MTKKNGRPGESLPLGEKSEGLNTFNGYFAVG